MRGISGLSILNGAALLLAAGVLVSCASGPPPPPDLTPQAAAPAISQSWVQEQMNHFKVTFHSDGLIECGVEKISGSWWKSQTKTAMHGAPPTG